MPETETPVAPAPITAPAALPTATPPAATEPQKAEATVEPSLLGAAKAPEPKPGDKQVGDVKAEVKTEVAPEKYADFKLPDGVNLDKALLEKALPIFKELGLSQENAQKLVSFQAESVKAEVQGRLTEYQKQIDGWKAESLKALGPYDQWAGFSGKALDAFGSKELRQLLDETGLGNHPLLTKMLVAVGKAVGEDKPVIGDRHGVADPKTETELQMFPSMKEMILNGKK